ncbi:Hypothetical protein CAP_6587 [Chondromyces apiculatus DSM 436]|uniref:HNH nuclease domain-containing protein n=1 Tax=Chondromyces apiculatus DSM 436 TaxID=1192034 RepID=A0A017T129_9BACT|nr:Hypothetical protein CAP_6587 [Chondromyces apiculatus DSM 436]
MQAGAGRPGGGFIAWDVGDFDEGLRRVCKFDWASMGNPFDYAFKAGKTQEALAASLVNTPERSEEVYTLVRARGITQRVFRAALLRAYRGACAFCGLSFPEALEGAHIVPWRSCAPHERLDPRNGLLLCSTHHRLFDADRLTLTTDFVIEHHDAADSEGEYSAADEHLTRRLHGRRATVPERHDLRPRTTYIVRRNKMR